MSSQLLGNEQCFSPNLSHRASKGLPAGSVGFEGKCFIAQTARAGVPVQMKAEPGPSIPGFCTIEAARD
jgi:hypothetical protein